MGRLRISLSIAALCFAVYAFSIGTPFYSSDAQVMYEASRAIALEGRLDIPQTDLPQIIEGQDGRFYSKYDPGLPLIAAPLVAAADHISKTHAANRYAVAAVAVMLIPALAMAATMGFLYNLARQHASHRRSLAAVMLAAFTTLAYPYARLFFAEAVLAFCLTVAVWAVWNGQEWLVAASIGMGVLTRITTLIYVPILAVWLYRYKPTGWQRYFFWLILGVLIGGIGLAFHNQLRFGSFFNQGYEGEGFTGGGWIGLLFSPGKSIFIYAPPLVMSVLLWSRFRRQRPEMADLLAGLGIVAVLVFGTWWAWHGGWVWGPRFLVPVVPLWCLPLTALPISRRWVGALVCLAAIGLIIQLLATFTNVNSHYSAIFDDADPDSPRHYQIVHWENPPLIGAIEQASKGTFEEPAFFHLKDTGLSVQWHTHFPLFILLIGLAGGVSLVVSARPE